MSDSDDDCRRGPPASSSSDEWIYDLRSVYAAWITIFHERGIPWYKHSWGQDYFSTFGHFLQFGWFAMVVSDGQEQANHRFIINKADIHAFMRMVKKKYDMKLLFPPFLITIPKPTYTTSDFVIHYLDSLSEHDEVFIQFLREEASFRGCHSGRVSIDTHQDIELIWTRKNRTFLCVDFEWDERHPKNILELGYAVVRTGNLKKLGIDTPDPTDNYSRAHFVVEEHVDVVKNKYCPNYPWDYAFNDSHMINQEYVSMILIAIISAYSSPDLEGYTNELVFIGHGLSQDLKRLDDLGVKLPRNKAILDIAQYERKLYVAGLRPMTYDKKGEPRKNHATVGLGKILSLFPHPTQSSKRSTPLHRKDKPTMVRMKSYPGCQMHNAGNDAFMTLFAFQMLIEPGKTEVPFVKKVIGRPSVLGNGKLEGMPETEASLHLADPVYQPSNSPKTVQIQAYPRNIVSLGYLEVKKNLSSYQNATPVNTVPVAAPMTLGYNAVYWQGPQQF